MTVALAVRMTVEGANKAGYRHNHDRGVRIYRGFRRADDRGKGPGSKTALSMIPDTR
jgi:hypothetical protein